MESARASLRHFGQAAAQRWISRGSGREPSEKGSQVKPGPARQDRQSPALSDRGEQRPGEPDVTACRELLSRAKRVEQMMRNSGAFRFRRFGGSDIQVAVQLHRIEVNYLTFEALG